MKSIDKNKFLSLKIIIFKWSCVTTYRFTEFMRNKYDYRKPNKSITNIVWWDLSHFILWTFRLEINHTDCAPRKTFGSNFNDSFSYVSYVCRQRWCYPYSVYVLINKYLFCVQPSMKAIRYYNLPSRL